MSSMVMGGNYAGTKASRESLAVRLVILHILALSVGFFLLGFGSIVTALFALLILTCYLYFGRYGALLSTAAFLFTVTSHSFVILATGSEDYRHIFTNFVASITTVVLAMTIIRIISVQETRRQSLIHSQQRERLQYERVLTIMNNLSDAAFSTDEHGVISLYNAASLELLDTNDNLKGRNIKELFSLTDEAGSQTDIMSLLKTATRASRRDDLSHTYIDGEVIRMEISFAPIRSSFSSSKKKNTQGYIVIMRDITKQKSLEEERDEFISVVSHELRTPITIVEGTVSNLALMMNRPTLPKPELLQKSLLTAHEQILYLARMVNDLSTLSRAERGVADTPEVIAVDTLLHTMHHQYEKDATAKGLHLNLDLGTKLGSVHASRLYLEELLQNFITNAIKYTKTGSITIIAKRTKDTVTFTVKDSGIGISRSDQSKVFEKFYRSEDYRIRETNGTGLGLYVSGKLAHKLQTTIELKSRLNHGSSFSFSLPVDETA